MAISQSPAATRPGIVLDQPSGRETVETSLSGQALLNSPLLNKGGAFTEDERADLELDGLLPAHVSTMEEQLRRTYENFRAKQSDIERYIFLAALQDRNETLYYRLLSEHVREMAPIVYTPVVGLACQSYSHIYRRPRGLYISYEQRDKIETILRHAPNSQARVIVVTDGERILGLGDLGIGGMGIPIGKLALYTLCAGIHPAATQPIVLDVGTDNPSLLDDPLYLGWRHRRIRGPEFDEMIEAFVAGVRRVFPGALLQWEDFAKHDARRLLQRYRDEICSFNDDIQGTGAVTLAGLLSAVHTTRTRLRDQRVVVLGAGSAATGICEQIVAAMEGDSLSPEAARDRIYLVDSHGLVHTGRVNLETEKAPYAQPLEKVRLWSPAGPDLIALDNVVQAVRPTVLIGTAAQPGAFGEQLVREMARHVERPIIFPLSNPTALSEAHPADLLAWTEGRALIATGSPFDEVEYAGRRIPVGQCNNMFIFPGVGLGVLVSGASRVTDGMFVAAARALSARSPARETPDASLFPEIEQVRAVSRDVAIAVALAAQAEGTAGRLAPDDLARRVDAAMWQPRYPHIRHRIDAPAEPQRHHHWWMPWRQRQ